MEPFEISGVQVIPETAEERNTIFHKRIVASRPIPNTRVGNYLDLECGHRVQAFGPIELARGVVLCTTCKQVVANRRRIISILEELRGAGLFDFALKVKATGTTATSKDLDTLGFYEIEVEIEVPLLVAQAPATVSEAARAFWDGIRFGRQ